VSTEHPEPAAEGLRQAVGRKGSFLGTLRAVAWSFFGVRRGKGLENDLAQLNPVHVIIAGVMGAALFVLLLVMLVRWIIAAGVAA